MKRPEANPDRTKAITVPTGTPTLEAMEKEVDLLIHDLCQTGTNNVHDMRVVNTHAKSHLEKTP